MINFLIKFLGGFTEDEMNKVLAALQKAQRNDTPKDKKTEKFVKKK